MKDHYTRRHQIEAILSALSHSDSPAVIQLLLSVARRHRTKSIQEKARVLIDGIANRNNWTQDELADRTVPTAGFDANGVQTLQLGSRELLVKLRSDLKITLENESGKVIKSLPAARQDDDPEQFKQAKKDFSSSKKELKQVLDLQTKRLYEAMCVGRKWHYSEWREYLLEHPIVRHLVQRLLWRIDDGKNDVIIRPTAELELINLDDEEYHPDSAATIVVAHASEFNNDDPKKWLKHFKDEKVTPLFHQCEQPKYLLELKDNLSKKLNYKRGYLSDAFTVRGILTKRGYQRGQAEDAGFFDHYFKDFYSLGLRAVISFSGNCLPEENCTAALYDMAFINTDHRGWLNENNYNDLDKIPRSLLWEVMLDYEAVAAKSRYEQDWETKIPW